MSNIDKPKSKRKHLMIFLAIIICLVVIKIVWVHCATRNNGSFEKEKTDILQRRDYLLGKIITTPQQLIDEMPSVVGRQFQGEWALYSCSMLSSALVNITLIYDEDKEQAISNIDSLIQIVLSPELRQYDAVRWGEDPLDYLDGDNSHISYLSHLAWMIGGYKRIGGGEKYDSLYHSICETMNRRIRETRSHNLPTYPGEVVYVPDMLVAIAALKIYSRQYDGKYSTTVNNWMLEAKTHRIDRRNGLMASFLPTNGMDTLYNAPIKGSYTALSCYYLTFIDRIFAEEQYKLLKDYFLQNKPFVGIKENLDRNQWLGMDIDAGPIICNLSPSGTAFTVGSATFFHDNELRSRFLKTGEIAGSTIQWKGKKHYFLSNIALVGEAIMLNMRTAVDWYPKSEYIGSDEGTFNPINFFGIPMMGDIDTIVDQILDLKILDTKKIDKSWSGGSVLKAYEFDQIMFWGVPGKLVVQYFDKEDVSIVKQISFTVSEPSDKAIERLQTIIYSYYGEPYCPNWWVLKNFHIMIINRGANKEWWYVRFEL